ncbi:MAG: WYL domain-containing transcriptional regulator [Nitrospirae bacterium]|nr:WYL domain-containing transcriptional regulator [Nitrospirota bacterium]MDA1304961.1 WYL domain-containing transcriptional regulator [Nitrospirota bacterium]
MGRKGRTYSQAERLARLMRTLASRAITINDITHEFQISRRQAYRDLKRIEEEGHPLTQEIAFPERTWQLPLAYRGLPPISVSPYELMSLYFAKSQMAYLAGTPFTEDLEALTRRIEASLPTKTVNHVDRLVQVFAPLQRPTRAYDKKKEVLKGLRRALLLQQTVTLHHQKPGYNEPVAHKVDPYVLLLYQYGLYILGFSHRAKALRLFAVERIQEVTPTEERFSLPPNFSSDWTSERLFGLLDDPPLKVRVRFSPEVAYLIKERQWHPTQSVKSLKDGGVVLTLKAGGLDELTSWVLSFGQNAQVLAPRSLKEAVMSHLAAAQKQYGR